ncbi:Glycosyltransferase, catalytic subunit of cellulose synthase and poly-beta-1,6-N-acetylglucosamine synthase [Paracoccus isoporae]|uniref:Glycosyltransferase, catalytic subunit of cellulose synthase and poly-beta-1,6-N-acetylglucosamine synthase n=1 Tax=Paracoccus isoporae TaxID=591205 RepID=A0A1G6XGX6_9RHOB|nr:glycosyltransferase [Paracoccus isoporae]SDD77043.1 Glycosyltransferase, catalytic subunit of cellulose synthase and poly-beta-1,6-N-acetylglucosamine synthase [Paracoccus isoporae]
MIEAIFWVSAAMLFYSVAGYGLILLALAACLPARRSASGPPPRRVSFLIAAYNEAPVIAEKLRNCLSLDSGGAEVEIVLVSDGSSDDTVSRARSVRDRRIAVIAAPRLGKAEALGLGLLECGGDVVVFSDANAMLEPGSLAALLRHFADPQIGGVCGRITVRSTRGTGGMGYAESLYWRYDQALKRAESRLGGAVSAQGSVYAMRRELAAAPAPGCTDDFIISTGAVAAGRRLVFEPDAQTVERVTEQAGAEMGRRIRSSERGWRSLMRVAGLMNPLRHGLYAWQLISHKLVRRLNPLFLALLFASSLLLIGQGAFYSAIAAVQILFYLAALAGLLIPRLRRIKAVAVAGFVVMAHLAMARGFWRYISGRKSLLWTPAREPEPRP